MTRVLSAEDERAILAVLLRYASGIDGRDWPLFRTCFTDDFHGDYGAFGTWNSADAFVGAMRGLHEQVGPTLHRISNVVVHAAGPGAVPPVAEARSYVDAVLMGIAADGSFNQAIGFYDDVLVLTADGWRIRSRHYKVVRQCSG